ncbi:MAG TPA: hypothetical protein VK422_09335, partial [Pyrinomonadaceae bacterium]|nr:hypothetical protein [Pyrinomonadaceae bacterium]
DVVQAETRAGTGRATTHAKSFCNRVATRPFMKGMKVANCNTAARIPMTETPKPGALHPPVAQHAFEQE